MAFYKCKMCGGALEVEEGKSVITCEFCGTTQTVHSFDDEKKNHLFSRADELRFRHEFDKASGIYESIIAEFPNEAEAYWGLLLCKYGIDYVDDPATGKKIPTCNRTSFDSIFEDPDYKNVLKYADVISKDVYEEEANKIETIRKDIIKISSQETPYDIFICFKDTDLGKRTPDSVLAEEIYDDLVQRGYRVFFSRISLEDKLGTQFEPYIFSALYSSKILIHVTKNAKYSEAPWVVNEWSRFLDMAKEDKTKYAFVCYQDVDPATLPERIRGLQSLDMSKLGAIQDIHRFINKYFKDVKKEEPSKKEEKQVMGSQYDQMLDEMIVANNYYIAKDELKRTVKDVTSTNKLLLDGQLYQPEKEVIDATISVEGTDLEVKNNEDIKNHLLYNGKKYTSHLPKKYTDKDQKDLSILFGVLALILSITGAVLLYVLNDTVGSMSLVAYIFIAIIPVAIATIASWFVLYFIYTMIYGIVFGFINIKHNKELAKRQANFSRLYDEDYDRYIKMFHDELLKKSDTVNAPIRLANNEKKEKANKILTLLNDANKKSIEMEELFKETYCESIFPITYVKDWSTVIRMLVLILNKRADNVTNLISIYESEDWDKRNLSTCIEEYRLLMSTSKSVKEILKQGTQSFKEFTGEIQNLKNLNEELKPFIVDLDSKN